MDFPEYYPAGHDNIEGLIGEGSPSALSPKEDMAFLFCGSGDARHLFGCLIDLQASGPSPMQMFSSPGKLGKIHFTLVDLNPAAIARTMIIFDMITVYMVYKAQKLPRIEDGLVVLAYLFSSFLVPPFVVVKTLEHIRALIHSLEKDGDLPGTTVSIFYVPRETRVQVLRVLKQWAKSLDDDLPPKKIRAAILKVRQNNLDRDNARMPGFDQNRTSQQCRSDFDDFGVVFSEGPFMQRREPELVPLVRALRSGSIEAKKSLAEYLDTHWKANPTTFDLDFEKQKELEPPNEGEVRPNVEGYPLNLIETLLDPLGLSHGSTDENFLSGLGQMFDLLAITVMTMNDRLRVELIAGEMADFLERLQHGCLEHRSHRPPDSDSFDPTTFPRQYDRIHMSNIPDYIGGPLSAHMYGSPLLRTGKTANLRYNNLLNPPMFSHPRAIPVRVLAYA